MRAPRRLLGVLVALGAVALPAAPAAASRLAGPDRFATAATVSASWATAGVERVYVATGLDFPDALAAGPVAGARRAPILLVRPDGVPDATATELTRLRPREIVVVGGPASVPDAVAAALTPFTSGAVVRVAGPSRFDTAAELSRSAFGPGVPIVFVASGAGYADALAAGAAGTRSGGPVLLVNRDELPTATAAELARLAPQRVVVVGGPASVGDTVVAALAGVTSAPVTRIGGADRFDTAAALARATAAPGQPTYLATGFGFADALAVAPLGGAVLLVPGVCTPFDAHAQVLRLATAPILVGGPLAVADEATRLVCGRGHDGAPADAGQPLSWVGDQGQRRVTFVGDSSLAGVRWTGAFGNLMHLPAVLDAESCRRVAVDSCRGRERYAPLNGLDALRRQPDLGDTVVVMMGYNDSAADMAAGVEAVLAEARQRGVRQVVWLTLRTTGVTYTSPLGRSNAATFVQSNAVLRDAAARHPELRLVDWDAHATGRTDWTYEDGIHLTPAGAEELTRLLTDVLARP